MNSIYRRFKQLNKMPGEVYREQPGRKTFATNIDGEDVFVKMHYGVGWREIFKNLLQLKNPVLGARPEYLALTKLHQLNIPTLEVKEFGETGINPAHQHSFLVTRALKNTISLESLCETWLEQPPSVQFKRRLIFKVAEIAAKIHANGINHRDFYICHFLLDEKLYQESQQIKLSLIDLHRAQIRHKTPWRWQVKDVAGLYFSALRIGLTRRDFFYFICCYQKMLGAKKFKFKKFWFEVEERAWRLYEKTYYHYDHRHLIHMWSTPAIDEKFKQNLLCDPDAVMEKSQCLKEDNTTTVVKYIDDNKTYIIKRYNVCTFKMWFKRLFKISRARRCWFQAIRLRQLGIHTPKPYAMLEQMLSNRSYLVTECLSGEDLFKQLSEDPGRIEYWAQQINTLFSMFKAIHTAHGDMKATNLWCHQQELYVLDLDGMNYYCSNRALKKALEKDRKRFLRNWNNTKFHTIFQKILS